MEKKYPSQVAPKFTIRFPEGLREEISRFAQKNHRSMKAEIIARLEESLSKESGVREGKAAYMTEDDLIDEIRQLSIEKQHALLTLIRKS